MTNKPVTPAHGSPPSQSTAHNGATVPTLLRPTQLPKPTPPAPAPSSGKQ